MGTEQSRDQQNENVQENYWQRDVNLCYDQQYNANLSAPPFQNKSRSNCQGFQNYSSYKDRKPLENIGNQNMKERGKSQERYLSHQENNNKNEVSLQDLPKILPQSSSCEGFQHTNQLYHGKSQLSQENNYHQLDHQMDNSNFTSNSSNLNSNSNSTKIHFKQNQDRLKIFSMQTNNNLSSGRVSMEHDNIQFNIQNTMENEFLNSQGYSLNKPLNLQKWPVQNKVESRGSDMCMRLDREKLQVNQHDHLEVGQQRLYGHDDGNSRNLDQFRTQNLQFSSGLSPNQDYSVGETNVQQFTQSRKQFDNQPQLNVSEQSQSANLIDESSFLKSVDESTEQSQFLFSPEPKESLIELFSKNNLKSQQILQKVQNHPVKGVYNPGIVNQFISSRGKKRKIQEISCVDLTESSETNQNQFDSQFQDLIDNPENLLTSENYDKVLNPLSTLFLGNSGVQAPKRNTPTKVMNPFTLQNLKLINQNRFKRIKFNNDVQINLYEKVTPEKPQWVKDRDNLVLMNPFDIYQKELEEEKLAQIARNTFKSVHGFYGNQNLQESMSSRFRKNEYEYPWRFNQKVAEQDSVAQNASQAQASNSFIETQGRFLFKQQQTNENQKFSHPQSGNTIPQVDKDRSVILDSQSDEYNQMIDKFNQAHISDPSTAPYDQTISPSVSKSSPQPKISISGDHQQPCQDIFSENLDCAKNVEFQEIIRGFLDEDFLRDISKVDDSQVNIQEQQVQQENHMHYSESDVQME
eukprot:403341211